MKALMEVTNSVEIQFTNPGLYLQLKARRRTFLHFQDPQGDGLH